MAADESRAAGHEDVPGERAAVGGGERERAAVTAASAGGAGGRGAAVAAVDGARYGPRVRRLGERFDRRRTEPFELFRSEFGQHSFKIQEFS